MLLGRNFILFFVGSTLSAIGTAMVPVALSFALLRAGRSAGALGLILGAQTLPTVVLLLFGGVAGDRWPRRRIMIGADLLRFAAQSALAMALIDGAAPLLVVIVLTALIGAGTAFFYPARGGLIAQIVAKEQLARANAALSAANSAATILGPALAGVIVALAGAGWAIGLDGLSYAASALCLVVVRTQPSPRRAPVARSVLRDLRSGLSAFASRRWLWLVVAQFGLLNLVALAPFMVLAPVILARLPHGAQLWGALLSAIGIGGLAGAAAIMRWQPTRPVLALEIATALLVAPLVMLAAHGALPALLIGGIAYGAGAAVVNVMIGTLIQREIPPEAEGSDLSPSLGAPRVLLHGRRRARQTMNRLHMGFPATCSRSGSVHRRRPRARDIKAWRHPQAGPTDGNSQTQGRAQRAGISGGDRDHCLRHPDRFGT